ncbi:MAG: electron transport complex subunit E [Calditrichaeota bacterium]|nr:MAG: electron transport complex subunit E [Calditrichota bacterium]MBL1207693.1 electron transport complex subunit E [Calditrichota bacterium]NOG47527.1 electron transport complex subunit E [Calditrichota bacterium]
MPETKKNMPSNMETFVKGVWKDNPVFVMLLGMCPVLAVTNSVMNALVMGIATTFVLLLSNILVSSLRNFIPKQVRIATYILIIATFVTVADYAIKAVSLEVHKSLGAFISLIVVNCMILGRAEAFASKSTIGKSILDALGQGAGFTIAVLALGIVREVLGNGTFLGFSLFGENFQPLVIMILPGGAFFVLGAYLLFFNWLKERKEKQEKVDGTLEQVA